MPGEYGPLSAGLSPLDTPQTPRRRFSNASSSSNSGASLRALEMSDGPIQANPHRRGSLVSSLSGLEYRPDLLPLTLSEDVERREDVVMEKTVGLVNGKTSSSPCDLQGMQVGSGIFSSPGVVLANTESVGASLAVWVISGLLAWTGASSFAELGSTIPLSGGAQAYLAYSYGHLVSFLYSWTAISALKPGSCAIIALIFGEYVMRLFHPQDMPADMIPQWQIMIVAIICILFVTFLCVVSPRAGTRAAVLLTTIKLAALVLVTVLGFVQLVRGRESSSFREPLFMGTTPNPSSFALALYSGLWAFDGWDTVNLVSGEMKDAQRNLPRVIHASMGIVVVRGILNVKVKSSSNIVDNSTNEKVLFLCANVSYFIVLDKLTVESSNTVALDFGRALFGSLGGVLFSVMVAISCFGALNSSFFTSARLIYAAAQEGLLPNVFSRLHPTFKTPLNATVLNLVLTIFFIVVGGGFRALVNFYSIASWGFYFLTVMGLLVLRVKEPNLERPYKTWIITPLTFSAVALFLLSMPIAAAPLEALAAVAFIAVGIPIYYISQWSQRDARVMRNEDDPRGILGMFAMLTHMDPDEVAKFMSQINFTPQDMMNAMRQPGGLRDFLQSAGGNNVGSKQIPMNDLDGIAELVKSAKRRFKQESSLGPSAAPQTNRASLSMKFLGSRRYAEGMVGKRELRQTYKGIEAHVSRQPLDQLKPIRMVSVMFGVEDTAGNVRQVSVYNYPGASGASLAAIDALFSVGTIMAIREPTLRMMAQGDEAHIRIDCPSDIVMLRWDHKLLKGVKWQSGDHLSNTPIAPKSEEKWRELGNGYFKSGWFVQAILAYSRGLHRYPGSILLYLNRSLASLRLGYYGAALADALHVVEAAGTSITSKVKALFRAGQAKYGMGLWGDAEELFTQTSELDDAEADNVQVWLKKCRERMAESMDGTYNWIHLFDLAGEKAGQRLEVADYLGPVDVVGMSSRGGGRGVVATRDVKCGELLVVSKAFACCFPEDFPNEGTLCVVNILKECREGGCSTYLDTKIAERLAGDPGSASLLYGLYAGPQQNLPPQEYTVQRSWPTDVMNDYLTFEAVVDMARIDGITSYNCFTPSQPHDVRQKHHSETDGFGMDAASALFTFPSLFNHSCAPNTHSFCLGDVMIIRAATYVPKGEELFVCYGGEGETYLSRARSGIVAQLVPDCDCVLCTADKTDGDVACRRREEIVKGIPSWNSVEIARAGIKKLEKTYSIETPIGLRGGMYKAYRQLSMLMFLKGDYTMFVQERVKMFEYLGMKMRNTETGAKSKRRARRNSLPMERSSVGPICASIGGEELVDACMSVASVLLGVLGNAERAESWLRFAVWLHDKEWGGGPALFLKRNPNEEGQLKALFGKLEREGRLMISPL
ncbi:hypothetical protein FRB96_007202 [Tulasnella sp. 330]|nr:hypothetical protein FRB96_007202 [Tulasnella sp. 330]